MTRAVLQLTPEYLHLVPSSDMAPSRRIPKRAYRRGTGIFDTCPSLPQPDIFCRSCNISDPWLFHEHGICTPWIYFGRISCSVDISSVFLSPLASPRDNGSSGVYKGIGSSCHTSIAMLINSIVMDSSSLKRNGYSSSSKKLSSVIPAMRLSGCCETAS